MKIFLDTVGCRLNQSEIETFARQFRAAGHALVPDASQADLVVINTCAVTGAAAADSRQKVRQAARLGAGSIVVTGCWASLEPDCVRALPLVERVVENDRKDQLVMDVLNLPEQDFEMGERVPLPGVRQRTRAFIKIQDGCDHHCTFCVTRIARGPSRSRTSAQVLADIQAAIQGGSQEMILTGVHLGAWGKDLQAQPRLDELIRLILAETDVPRLRLSSLEPWDLPQDFFSLWQDPRLCRHLHLPLQSGCPATLRRMGRKTTPGEFASLLAEARSAVPGLAVTTDVIVGFPGEDEREFAQSLDFVHAMNFAGGHVFTFSARPGTPAATMPNQVPHPVRKERSATMRGVIARTAAAYRQTFMGVSLPVLWESATSTGGQCWQLSGLTDNYLRVVSQAPQQISNQISSVRLTMQMPDALYGEITG